MGEIASVNIKLGNFYYVKTTIISTLAYKIDFSNFPLMMISLYNICLEYSNLRGLRSKKRANGTYMNDLF